MVKVHSCFTMRKTVINKPGQKKVIGVAAWRMCNNSVSLALLFTLDGSVNYDYLSHVWIFKTCWESLAL